MKFSAGDLGYCALIQRFLYNSSLLCKSLQSLGIRAINRDHKDSEKMHTSLSVLLWTSILETLIYTEKIN